MKEWDVIESRVLLERWWMRLRVDHVRLPNGEELPEFHVVEYPDWALVIAMDDDKRLLLVEQYRYGIGRTSIEFAAGMIEPGEDPMVAAGRELQEETGYEASELTRIGKWAADPSRQTEYAHAFVARNVAKSGTPSPDATEELRVIRLTVQDVLDAIANGTMMHAIHIAAFYRALDLGLIDR